MRGANQNMREYKVTVSVTASAKAIQKPTPPLSNAGKTKNIGIDGKKNQNALCATLATRSGSLVSRHNQTKVSSETNGKDTISPPMPGQRRATSDATATMPPEIAALRMK